MESLLLKGVFTRFSESRGGVTVPSSGFRELESLLPQHPQHEGSPLGDLLLLVEESDFSSLPALREGSFLLHGSKDDSGYCSPAVYKSKLALDQVLRAGTWKRLFLFVPSVFPVDFCPQAPGFLSSWACGSGLVRGCAYCTFCSEHLHPARTWSDRETRVFHPFLVDPFRGQATDCQIQYAWPWSSACSHERNNPTTPLLVARGVEGLVVCSSAVLPSSQ